MAAYNSPLVFQRADPYIIKADGKYYFTASVPEFDAIELRTADTVNGLSSASPKIIWKKHESGEMSANIWAPEIHYLFGKWVIYFAAGTAADKGHIRCYALMCDGDPMTDEWRECGRIKPAAGDPYSFKDFSLDMTVFENKGKWYAVWAQKSGRRFDISDLYIAELKAPTKLKTVRRLLTTPDFDWERVGFWVDEGPAILRHNGKIFLTFSASATGDMYCMGVMTCPEDADILNRSNWTKRETPLLKTIPELKIYGPGHNTFFEGDNGELLCALHFRDYSKINGDPLADHNRHAHVLPVAFDENDELIINPTADMLYNRKVENELQTGINV